jgi:putative adenylate-forming enzyme
MLRLIRTLLAYGRARHQHFVDRGALERHQAKHLKAHLKWLSAHSPYFAAFVDQPLAAWPCMDKKTMLEHFNQMNTAGLDLQTVMQVALAAEASRDFLPTIGRYTVGLSSGTSGQRAAFVVSAAEQAQWAGVMLAKTLPQGLFVGEKVALFLRANSNLYTAVRSRWIEFRFFDLFLPFEGHLSALTTYTPTILLAPTQVLRELAMAQLGGRLHLTPKRVYAIAEVLEPQDRTLIEQAFGPMHEIYQATEGFLASTCEHGVLHLNEEHIHIEPEWLDAEHRRFVPMITDFSRRTQPIVRYRLNDVLCARLSPCPCGRATQALDAIEGRCDDMLRLPNRQGQPMTVFADVIARALVQTLPMQADYQLHQIGATELMLYANVDDIALSRAQQHLVETLSALSVDTQSLIWGLETAVPPLHPAKKRRRIIRVAT